MTTKRIVWGLSLVVVVAALVSLLSSSSRLSGAVSPHHLLFREQNQLLFFFIDPVTGAGAVHEAGTATGSINGAVVGNFRTFPTGPTTFNFDIRTGIADTDGDQLIYRATGSGRFVCPPLGDPSPPFAGPAPAFPGPPGILGLGGPLAGTATITATNPSSKYVHLVGRTFDYRAVLSNRGDGCTTAGSLTGSVYVEVSGSQIHHR